MEDKTTGKQDKDITAEELLKELNPAERVSAIYSMQEGRTPQELKEFFDSL